MSKKIVLTLVILMVLNFFLPRMMPGDPFDFLSVEDGSTVVVLTEEQIQNYRSYYGLDKPLVRQFGEYVANALRGDFGRSIYYNRPVVEMVAERIGWTMALVSGSLLISSICGTLLGVLSAYRKEEKPFTDKLLMSLMMILSETPGFIIGLLLLIVFAVRLKWFPLSGGLSSFMDYQSHSQWVLDYLYHLFLPMSVLVLAGIGDFYLLGRQSSLSVIQSPYIETAVAKGLSKKRIILHHILPNAISPVIARAFSMMGMMIGGAVLVENVFSYPGIGQLMREAVGLRDYILLQGIFFFIGVFVLVFNSLADVINRKLNKKECL